MLILKKLSPKRRYTHNSTLYGGYPYSTPKPKTYNNSAHLGALGFSALALGCRIKARDLGSLRTVVEFKVRGLGFMIWGLGCMVWG